MPVADPPIMEMIMRMMLKVSIPTDVGNKAIKDGTLPKTVSDFIEKRKPEAAYFAADRGLRTAYFFFDLADPTDLPSVAEPFFMNLNATIEVAPAMNAEDLRTGLDKAMRSLR
jgi:hypothetical protein